MDSGVAKQLRRVRTLGRGASGAVVWLASDEASGELLAVKSAAAGGAAQQLQREERVLEGLSSPHIVPCLGSRAAAGGEYQLFLEFAPGGSLTDEAARSGGRLAERAIRAYAGDVARGLAYLHDRSLVHGDVKSRNVVIGGDGRAKLTDFGCARPAESSRPVGGTPAFMAPEVARGEEQGPAADVWALGCTVIEMATGRAPWSDMDDILAAMHRIGYTDDAPEVPRWLSPEAKHFLGECFMRVPGDRSTAAQLVKHPFVASAAAAARDAQPAKPERASPKTTLHDSFWDSDSDDEADETPASAAERIGALACAASALPDWDSDDEGWIALRGEHSQAVVEVETPPPTTEGAAADSIVWAEPLDEELEQLGVDSDVNDEYLRRIAGLAADATIRQDSLASKTIAQPSDHGGFEALRSLAEGKTIAQPSDHGGFEAVRSHSFGVSFRNRVKMKRIISAQICLFSVSRLHWHIGYFCLCPYCSRCDHRAARNQIGSMFQATHM
ncbi:hypothetical protein ACP4OV_029663 [Aristida adscensionis]